MVTSQGLGIGGCSYDVSLRCEHFHWGFGFRGGIFVDLCCQGKRKFWRREMERKDNERFYLFSSKFPILLSISLTQQPKNQQKSRHCPERVRSMSIWLLTIIFNDPCPSLRTFLGVPYLLQEGSPKMVSQCAGAASLWCKLSCLHRTWLWLESYV